MRIWTLLLISAMTACGADKASGGARSPAQDANQPVDTGIQRGASLAPGNPPECSGDGPMIVTDSAVAGLRLGQSAFEVQRRCVIVADSTAVDPNDGERYRILAVSFGADTVLAAIRRDTVMSISVLSPGIPTAESLRVGDPITKLLGFKGVTGQVGERDLGIMLPDHCGLVFLTDPPKGAETGDELDAQQLRQQTPEARIKAIEVVGCP